MLETTNFKYYCFWFIFKTEEMIRWKEKFDCVDCKFTAKGGNSTEPGILFLSPILDDFHLFLDEERR